MKLRCTFVFIALLTGCHAAAAADGDREDWQPLYDLVNPELQAELERAISGNPGWRRLAASGRMAVGLVDMAATQPRFARINGNLMMYAASLPKIAILLAAYVQLEEDKLPDTPGIRRDMTDMIRYSSNEAATRMIDRIGMERIDEILMDPRFGLYDESRGGGLWIGKRFAKQGQRIGDPLHNISHGATVTQICRFYYLLATGQLVGPGRTQQMLYDLSDPGLYHKFVYAVRNRAPDATLYRKSGTWQNWHSDSIWVKGKGWRNYILAAMVESPDGERIIRSVLPVVEEILKRGAAAPAGDRLKVYQASSSRQER
ncbi:MAG: serine hydrolase [Pseudomonadales bacterium]